MYSLLKDGIYLGDLRRGVRKMNIPARCGCRTGFTGTEQFRNSMRYLLVVIDEYIEDREQCA